jgi:HAD superfamily hydrolase (TIGR01509 family)
MIALFDLDGVIIDSEPQYDKFWSKQGELHGLGNNFASKIKGQTMPQILSKYFYEFSTESNNKLVSDCARFEAEMECPLIAGVEKFIDELKHKDVKTGLVTSSDDIKLSRIVKMFKMNLWFDTIVTANHVAYSKPNPEGYLIAAANLSANIDECIVFEDSFAGIEAGKNAKMKVVALATTNSRKAIQDTGNANLIIDNFLNFSYEECLAVISQ